MDHGAPKKILVGVTGSIAAIKSPELVRLLKDHGYEVRCVMTKSAEQFVTAVSLGTLSGAPVVSDMFGADVWSIPHIKLPEESSLMVIAPVTATVIARCALGMAEEMVSLSYMNIRAPVLMAPAMHTTMWEHPGVQANVRILKERGVHFIGPYQGPLADQSRGEGRMAEPGEIIAAIENILSSNK